MFDKFSLLTLVFVWNNLAVPLVILYVLSFIFPTVSVNYMNMFLCLLIIWLIRGKLDLRLYYRRK